MNKVNKIKIAVAIPTYNRVKQLKFALEHLEHQQFDHTIIELFCVISNSCSTDDTFLFLNGLKSSTVNYIIVNNSPNTEMYVCATDNFRNCANAIPDYIDWVWFMGDDDYLTSPLVISQLANLIIDSSNIELSLILTTEDRRSLKTGRVVKESLYNLCKQIGFFDVLGWIASLVVRRAKFKLSILGDVFRGSDKCACPHSIAIFAECSNDNAVLIDSGWCNVQTKTSDDVKDTNVRWSTDGVFEGYYNMIDAFRYLRQKNLLNNDLGASFFRYHTYSIWDYLIATLVHQVLSRNEITALDMEHWNKIMLYTEFLSNPYERKCFLLNFYSIRSLVLQFVKNRPPDETIRNDLEKIKSMLMSASYPRTVLSE